MYVDIGAQGVNVLSLPQKFKVVVTLLDFKQKTSVSESLSHFTIKSVFVLGPLDKKTKK